MKPVFLYIGSYTDNNPGIHKLAYYPDTNRFQRLATNNSTPNPSFLAKRGNILYAANEVDDKSMLSSYYLSPENHDITLCSVVEGPGTTCCHVTLTDCLLVGTNYGTGDVIAAPRLPEGTLGEISLHIQHRGTKPRAHSSVLSANGKHLYVADLGTDKVLLYAVAGETLTPVAEVLVDTGQGPRHMACAADGKHLYVVTEYGAAVYVFQVTPEGTLVQQQMLTMPNQGASVLAAADLHLHPNGQFLYASVRGPNIIVVYAIAADGSLSLVQVSSSGGDWPRNFALSPDGALLFVANQNSGNIAVAPLDSKTGTLGEFLATYSVPTPACVLAADS